MAKRIKEGATTCGLNDILFPVELSDQQRVRKDRRRSNSTW